jgi:acyl-CoA synthetase (AMP-forming)/AMP-acid ligase II
LHITDRAKEMLKVSGFAVAPVEIEKLLFSHPDVADVAVYGIPDERFGEAATAAVVLRPGATCSAEDIIAFTRERLSGYKQVRRVRFVDDVPRNPAGKVLRRLLKAADPAVAQEVPGW